MDTRFRDGQRLRITAHGSQAELNGMTCKVVRRVMGTSEQAWVETDKDLPDNCRTFPKEDPRGNHVKVYSDEVEEI